LKKKYIHHIEYKNFYKKLKFMQCLSCKNEFEPKRIDAKFCSSTCRSRFKRGNLSVASEDLSVASKQNATDNLSVATDNSPNGIESNPNIQSEQVDNFPETTKFIQGSSQYVMEGDSVKSIFKKDDTPTSVICECTWCGERFGSNGGKCALYCKSCKTVEQRRKVREENEQIRKEYGRK